MIDRAPFGKRPFTLSSRYTVNVGGTADRPRVRIFDAKTKYERYSDWDLTLPNTVSLEVRVTKGGRTLGESRELYVFRDQGDRSELTISVDQRPLSVLVRIGFRFFPELVGRTAQQDRRLVADIEAELGLKQNDPPAGLEC
jgi:hypothetical protein